MAHATAAAAASATGAAPSSDRAAADNDIAPSIDGLALVDDDNETSSSTDKCWSREKEEAHNGVLSLATSDYDWTLVISTSATRDDGNDEDEDEDEDEEDKKKTKTLQEQTTTFYVHKAALSAGPRRCLYFSTLFSMQDNRFTETQGNVSRIILETKEAFDAFPAMLDFLYDKSSSSTITNTNAIPLRSLARYFQCPALAQQVDDFIHAECLEYTTAIHVLLTAFESDNIELQESVRKYIVKHFGNVTNGNEEEEEENEHNDGLTALPLELFQSIVCDPNLHQEHHSAAFRRVVSYFFARTGHEGKMKELQQHQPSLLNARLFGDLTSHFCVQNNLRVAQAALNNDSTVRKCLYLIGTLEDDPPPPPPFDNDDNGAEERNDDDHHKAWMHLTKLCQMCTDHIVQESDWWEEEEMAEHLGLYHQDNCSPGSRRIIEACMMQSAQQQLEQVREVQEQVREMQEGVREGQEGVREVQEQMMVVQERMRQAREEANYWQERLNAVEEEFREVQERVREVQERCRKAQERANEVEGRANALDERANSLEAFLLRRR